jgi:hypothetical protein
MDRVNVLAVAQLNQNLADLGLLVGLLDAQQSPTIR